MYTFILFDLDGTISDPKVGICTSVQYALKKYNIEVSDIDTLTPFIGPPLRDSFMRYYNIPSEEIENCIAYYRERFSTIGLFENDLYDGIPELLQKLKENGCQVAISSSKPTVFVRKILDYFNITQYFDVIVGSELNGKRDEKIDVIYETLDQLSNGQPIDKSKVVMIGDRKFDIEASLQAGLSNIGVSYGYGSIEELETAGAQKIAHSVSELSDMLLS